MQTTKRKAKWLNYSWSDKLFLIVVYTVIILITLVCLYPLYYTVIASVSDAGDVYTGKVNFLPSQFTVEAYTLVFQNKSIWRGYANTIFYTVVGTCFNLFLTIPTAYALSKKRMLGRNFLMTMFLITMYFGGGMIPTYILFKNLHLVNTPWIMIISGGLSVYNVIVTRTYFQNNIPETLFEAARIDGASEFRIFFQLVLPLSAPILAVITLYYAVGHWSSYFTAMIYITKSELHPLQMVLRRILILNETAYQDAMQSGNAEMIEDALRRSQMAVTMKYALVFIASFPMLVLYPFIQKYFVKGIMVGSLKG
ncbi:MAG: carbohydrate ABC transporter permease [Lachnospiraceae bacterium]|nr:carbohydrate ABC transporter permease [Lachnospiraceae bacterium]